MELIEALQRFGLNKNEANVYLALLQLGPSPVLGISRRTGLKRPTIYLILDELIKNGLAALVPQEKKKLFIALPPDSLKEKLEHQTDLLRQVLPELTAIYRTQTAKPTIQIFESREGIMNVYKEITNFKDGEILSFFSAETIPQEFFESFELFIRALKEKKILLREIVYTKYKNHFYIQKTKNLPNHEIRKTTAQYKFFTDNFIYDNKVAIFSFKKRFAVVVESEDLANSFRSLFELAWKSAQQI
jgi:sugar-specific transcriptional regulator TrmB